jgi:predicted tellurium resistance membrane protein TerC
MRLVAGRLIELIRTYPALVDGAFVVIGWVALKLLAEYAHDIHIIGWEIPKTISLGLIAVIFAFYWIKARRHPVTSDADDMPPPSVPPADAAGEAPPRV